MENLTEFEKRIIEEVIRYSPESWEYGLEMCLKWAKSYSEVAKRIIKKLVKVLDWSDEKATMDFIVELMKKLDHETLQDLTKIFLDIIKKINEEDREHFKKNAFVKKIINKE